MKICAYVDQAFTVELDEEGQRLWDADDPLFYRWLLPKIQLSEDDVQTVWEVDEPPS